MSKVISYRVEHSKIIIFDWAARTYFQCPKIECQTIENELISLGYNDSYVLNERKNFSLLESEGSDYVESPLAAYIEITNSCNMKCKHCFKSHIPYHSNIKNENIYLIIDELENMGVFELRFVGYEPTLNLELRDIVQYAQNKGFYLVLNSNGFYSDEKQYEIISYGFNEFLISIDGDEKYHDDLRMQGSFERALSFVQKLGNLKIRTKINMTVNKENIKYIAYMAHLASLSSVNFNVIPMRMIGMGEREMEKSSELSPNLMMEIAKIVEKLRIEITNILIYLTYHDYLTDNHNVQYHKSQYSDPCPGVNNMSILNNGQVFFCDLMANLGDEFCLGNLFETSIIDIWRGHRTTHYKSLKKSQKCLKCTNYMKRCNGGCFIERYLYNGRKYQDPLCYVDLLEGKTLNVPQYDRGSYYDEAYFKDGIMTNKSLYTNYRYLPERSSNDASIITNIAKLQVGNNIIDFGSGMGYLMKAFHDIKINAYGVEISEYAQSNSILPQYSFRCLNNLPNINYSLLVALNVFEHLTVNEILEVATFALMNRLNVLFTVPISRYEGGDYINPIFDKDKSHILRRPILWWQHFWEMKTYDVKVIEDENNELFHGKSGMVLMYCCISNNHNLGR